jgi:hypothetical protein
LLEHSSSAEYEKNQDWEQLLDPFWMTNYKSQLSDSVLNVGDEKWIVEEEDIVLVNPPLEKEKVLDGKSEIKEPRADNVLYTGYFANKNTERIHNSYATTFMNANAERDEEEAYRRKKKKAKKLAKAKEKLKDVLQNYEDCFARSPDQVPGTIPEDLCKHVIELKDAAS